MDPNSKGAQGTALEVAARLGSIEICELLLSHGANPNEVGQTAPLAVAAREGKFDVASLLIDRGADPLTASPTGVAPLHEAAKAGDLKSVEFLIKNGANVTALTQKGWPAIHYAIRQRHADVAAYLKRHGAKPGEIKPITELLANADVGAGKSLSEQHCEGCHNLVKGGPSLGPEIWNIVGRRVAGVSGFRYSPVFTELSGKWTYESLNRYLARPAEVIPGTSMNFVGIADAQDRANLIVFLRMLSDQPVPLP